MISEWYSDDELLSQFAMFFTDSEREHIDFQSLLGQIKFLDDGVTGEVNIKGRVFRFSLEFCNVEEVEN